MSFLKTLLYIVSGLFLISAAVCAGLFYQSGSIQSLGATLMFLCFGAFGIFVTFNLDSLRANGNAGRSTQTQRR